MTEAPTSAGLPLTEQPFERHREVVRDAAVDRIVERLRDRFGLHEVLDDQQLRTLADETADAALGLPPEHADLLGTQGRLLARQWATIDALRGELVRHGLRDGANP